VGGGNFGKVGVGVGCFTFDSATLVEPIFFLVACQSGDDQFKDNFSACFVDLAETEFELKC